MIDTAEEFAHTCHWPTCTVPVPEKMWGCKGHWFKLPPAIRNEIWRTYVPGQETRKDPSEAYLVAADKAHKWALRNPDKIEIDKT